METKPLSPARNWKHVLRWAGTGITAGLFIYLLIRQDWQKVGTALMQIPGWVLPLAFALYICGQLANGARWFTLLRAQDVTITYAQTLQLIFAGAFASNFLPSTIGGDALRILGIFQYTTNRVTAVASIILDRFLNVLAYITVLPVALMTVGGMLPAGTALASVGVMGGLNRLWQKAWLELRNAFSVWRERKSSVLAAFGISWLSIFVIFLALWLLANGLGIPVTLWQVMGINALTYLITLLPVSINGLGLREIAITGLYMQVGASVEQASALAIISRLMLMAETLPGALWAPGVLAGRKIP